MTEQSISEELRQAFQNSLAAFHDWDRDGPEPEISLESRPYTISAVCNLVWKFNDEIPNDDYDKLCRLADNIRHGQMTEAFYQRPPGEPVDHTYASGARCLQSLIDCRMAWYGRER